MCVCVQVHTDIHVNTTKQTLQGVAFPLDGEAVTALQQFKEKKLNYVQLVRDTNSHSAVNSTVEREFLWLISVILSPKIINFEKELIMLSNTDATEVKDLPKRIPKDAARYHFFRFKHSHEGDYLESAGTFSCV